MAKYEVKHPIHFQGKRYEVGAVVEMNKKEFEAHKVAVGEVTKEEKKQEETKKPEEKK